VAQIYKNFPNVINDPASSFEKEGTRRRDKGQGTRDKEDDISSY
jgi:hypothetical protein